MPSEERPVLLVSKCLGLADCRWNGGTIKSDLVSRLEPFARFITVCPEMEIGLGVPRDPIRVVMRREKRFLIQPASGCDLTEPMNRFADAFLSRSTPVDGFILKSRSPSCGIRDTKWYAGARAESIVARGPGFFGGAVLEKFPHLAVDDDKRLKDSRNQERFLTCLFLRCRFRNMREGASMAGLVEFHERNKFLLMAFSRKEMRAMGKIVADVGRKTTHEVLTTYERHFNTVFTRIPRRSAVINVLLHAFGYISKDLSSREKAVFLDSLEKCRRGALPLSACSVPMKSWVVRFDQQCLGRQTFFEPYPEVLMKVSGPKSQTRFIQPPREVRGSGG